MVGDSTSAADVDKLTDGAIMDLCVTDPPYNLAIGIENPEEAKKRHRRTDGLMIANDEMSDEDFYSFLKAFYTQMLRVLKEGGAYYVWHADSIGHVFRDALIDAGGQVKQILIWVKNALTLGRQDYQWKHESCIYGWKAGARHYFINDRKQTTVFEDQLDLDKMTKEQMRKMLEEMLADTIPTTVIHEDKPTRSGLHPTMKPVRLMSILINNSSKPKENVIDFFGGSGSTLIAC
jgi:DNA modification methylase